MSEFRAVIESYRDHHPAQWSQLLRDFKAPGNRLYGAFEDGRPVAFVVLVLENADGDPELANGAEIAHVHNLRVHSDEQGRGLGREFMRALEEEARRLSKRWLTLGVDDVNERAVRLYRGLGYEVFKTGEGRTPAETLLLMKKPL